MPTWRSQLIAERALRNIYLHVDKVGSTRSPRIVSNLPEHWKVSHEKNIEKETIKHAPRSATRRADQGDYREEASPHQAGDGRPASRAPYTPRHALFFGMPHLASTSSTTASGRTNWALRTIPDTSPPTSAESSACAGKRWSRRWGKAPHKNSSLWIVGGYRVLTSGTVSGARSSPAASRYRVGMPGGRRGVRRVRLSQDPAHQPRQAGRHHRQLPRQPCRPEFKISALEVATRSETEQREIDKVTKFQPAGHRESTMSKGRQKR